jgi:muramoyltetrapeptide carboxypeptidase
MLRPKPNIAVVAPSGIFSPTRLEAGMALVESWGASTIEAPNLHSTHRFTAGRMEERLYDLKWALGNDDIDAVWFARGGYGCAELLPHLDWDNFPKKPVIGFSDATALGCAMAKVEHTHFIHGPVLHSLADHCSQKSVEELRALLFDSACPSLEGEVLCGEADFIAPMVGGNLCMIGTMLGTPWQLVAGGSILAIEDIGEPPYKIQRMLNQLQQAGTLEGVRGIALGEFTGCSPGEGSAWTLDDLFVDFFAPLKIPVLHRLPFGHGPNNSPWVLGKKYRFHAKGLHVV